MIRNAVFAAGLILLSLQSAWPNGEGEVVVSIAPIHSLVKEVMGESGDPILLLRGYASPHSFQLKPSQLRKMHSARAVFYVSKSFETFLIRSFNGLPSSVAKISLMDASNIEIRPYREGGAWAVHEEEAHHHETLEGRDDHAFDDDPHIWLDPENAVTIVRQIEGELGKLFPENKALYGANAKTLVAKIQSMDKRLTEKLAPVLTMPFVVFHDSYQYFEKHYGLRAVGSILLEPKSSPSIARLQEIRAKIKETKAKCIFREPQFSDKLVRTASEGSTIKSGLLDPLGSDLPQGVGLYIGLMETLADAMVSCLK
ncbi:MAG: zinc ABC transporter substrate-binding protein [Sneathiella sp.]